jgi:hypothetical protein
LVSGGVVEIMALAIVTRPGCAGSCSGREPVGAQLRKQLEQRIARRLVSANV